MAKSSEQIKTMQDLYVHTLMDIYYAEKQIEKSLPKMMEKASNSELKSGFEKHLKETQGQIQRLEKVFEMEGIPAKGTNCPAIDGIIEEAQEIAGEVKDAEVLDAALVASAQAVEHYEITRYGTLIAWSEEMGKKDCARLFKETLAEERATDERLTKLAESRVNKKARH